MNTPNAKSTAQESHTHGMSPNARLEYGDLLKSFGARIESVAQAHKESAPFEVAKKRPSASSPHNATWDTPVHQTDNASTKQTSSPTTMNAHEKQKETQPLLLAEFQKRNTEVQKEMKSKNGLDAKRQPSSVTLIQRTNKALCGWTALIITAIVVLITSSLILYALAPVFVCKPESTKYMRPRVSHLRVWAVSFSLTFVVVLISVIWAFMRAKATP